MGYAMSAIALGVGYLVLLRAGKEKDFLRLSGMSIGIFLMLTAVISMCCASKYSSMKNGCPLMSKAPMCMFSTKH